MDPFVRGQHTRQNDAVASAGAEEAHVQDWRVAEVADVPPPGLHVDIEEPRLTLKRVPFDPTLDRSLGQIREAVRRQFHIAALAIERQHLAPARELWRRSGGLLHSELRTPHFGELPFNDSGLAHKPAVVTARPGILHRAVGDGFKVAQADEAAFLGTKMLGHVRANLLFGALDGPDPHFIHLALEILVVSRGRSTPVRPAQIVMLIVGEGSEAAGKPIAGDLLSVEIEPGALRAHGYRHMTPLVALDQSRPKQPRLGGIRVGWPIYPEV